MNVFEAMHLHITLDLNQACRALVKMKWLRLQSCLFS